MKHWLVFSGIDEFFDRLKGNKAYPDSSKGD
jgi:hypothetical protein